MDENGRFEQMPQTIGRYQIHNNIGYGAMGAVYKAFDPLIKRTLAIKTIRLDIPRQSPQYKSFIDRFYHEARISGTLSHPNIVTLFDIGEENGLPYLAMEFVEGETIASLLEKGKRFKPERVINLVSQVASAIDYAHSKGVIHRDIKPSNLILYEGEKVKVTDFGIAKLVDAELTQSGTLLGTPSYMSPEQAMGDKLDGRSDIFSLGVCAFEMLSGEQPFPGTNVTSILYKLVHVEPIEPANLEMHGLVPQKWHEVFGKVLAKKPDDRYQTATEFVQDLEYCLGAWFGAVPDTTLVEAPVPETAPMPPAPRAQEEATTAIPALARPEAPAAPSFPTGDEIEMTVSMGAPDLEEAARAMRPGRDTLVEAGGAAQFGREGAAHAAMPAGPPQGEGTVLLSAPPLPPAEVGEGTVVLPSTSAAPAPAQRKTEGTVLLPAPSLPEAPSGHPPAQQGEIEGTVMLPSPAKAPPQPPVAAPAHAEVEGTLLMASPLTAAPPPVEGTVLMPSPVKAPPVSAPPAPHPEVEGTILMQVPAMPAPAVEGTVLMPSPVRPPQAPVPRAPYPEVEGTMLMPVPAMPPAGHAAPPAHPGAETTLVSGAATAPSKAQAKAASAAEAPASRKGVPPMAIAAAGGAVVIVAAAVLGIWYLRRGGEVAPPTPAPATPAPVASVAPTPEPPPPAAVTGSLRVESQPSAATVTLDNEPRGTTPVSIADLAMGEHEVKVELKGYAPSVEKVVLAPGAPTAELKLTLSRTAAPVGSAQIRSVPEGALVRIDGIAVGVTPLKDHRLKVGSHSVDLTADGFEQWSGTVAVKEGRRAKVDAVLKAIPKATPTPEVKVDVVDPNKVYLPGEVDTQPKKLSGASAAYPKNAPGLKSGEAVSVAVEFVVAANGDVTDVRVAQSGGQAVDEAVAAAVSQWKYSAGVKKGIKVKVRVTFRQTFKSG